MRTLQKGGMEILRAYDEVVRCDPAEYDDGARDEPEEDVEPVVGGPPAQDDGGHDQGHAQEHGGLATDFVSLKRKREENKIN